MNIIALNPAVVWVRDRLLASLELGRKQCLRQMIHSRSVGFGYLGFGMGLRLRF